MDRRGFVASLGAAGAVGLTGCLGGDNDEGDSTPLGSHPISEGFEDQPRLGASDAPTAVVAFEDPSCHSCHSFETDVLPTVREEMIDTGDTRLYYRMFVRPVQPWGTDAGGALEATYARDEGVFWDLKTFYYDEFDFTTDDILPRTRDFLADTSVDADAVVEDARNGEYDGEMETDMSVGDSAGVRGTPTFFLIDGDEVVARVVGPQSASVFRNALGL
jgi:protein-disulfide isomerase